MATIMQETRVELSGRESIALGPLDAWRIECHSGEIWVTVDGERRDVVLGAGRGWTVESDGPVVVSAFGPSVFSLRGPQHTSLAARVRTALGWPPAGFPGLALFHPSIR